MIMKCPRHTVDTWARVRRPLLPLEIQMLVSRAQGSGSIQGVQVRVPKYTGSKTIKMRLVWRVLGYPNAAQYLDPPHPGWYVYDVRKVKP